MQSSFKNTLTVVFKWSDNALMTMFRRSLKNFLKDEILRDDRTPQKFTKFIQQAVKIDDQWYKRNMKKKYERKSYDRAEICSQRRIKNHKGSSNAYTNIESYESVFMDLNTAEWSETKNRKKWFEGKRTLTCDKSSQMMKNCRAKNKVSW